MYEYLFLNNKYCQTKKKKKKNLKLNFQMYFLYLSNFSISHVDVKNKDYYNCMTFYFNIIF